MKFIKTILTLSFLVPTFAHAAMFENTTELIDGVGSLISILIPIVAALALLFFFWGLAKFILNAGSEEAQTEGKNIMKWGIVALFVMVAIWGIVAFIEDDLLSEYSGIRSPGGSSWLPFDDFNGDDQGDGPIIFSGDGPCEDGPTRDC